MSFDNLIDKRKNSNFSQDIIGNYNQIIKPNILRPSAINIKNHNISKGSKTNRSLADFVE